MKKTHRIVAILLVIAMLLTMFAGVPLVANANELSEEYTDFYNNLFASCLGPYLITTQPDGALIPEENTEITRDSISVNYDGGIVELPRLQWKYYYTVTDADSNWFIPDFVYPVLAWKNAALGTTTTINVCDFETNEIVTSFNVSLPDEVDTLKQNGVDFWYPDEDNEEYEISAKELVDVSSDLTNHLISSGVESCKLDASPLVYPSSLAACAIIMPTYSYVVVDDLPDSFKTFTGTYHCLRDEAIQAYAFPEKPAKSNTYNIKKYVGGLSSNVARPALLFAGDRVDGCSYDNNTGDCLTASFDAEDDASDHFSFIATDTDLYAYRTTRIDGDEFDNLISDAVSGTTCKWESETSYSLDPAASENEAAIVDGSVIRCGPLSFSDFVNNNAGLISYVNDDDPYTIMNAKRTETSTVPLYGETLLFCGYVPGLANISLEANKANITFKYYVEDDQGQYELKYTETVKADKMDTTDLWQMPEREGYTPDCWYTNTGLSTAYDPNAIDKVNDGTYNLYGKYKYTGGYYTVSFYNDITKAMENHTLRVIDTITLPADPKPKNGYIFKCWMFVNDVSDTTGTVYDPETFSPEPDGVYTLKTFWATKGVITRILTSKATYYTTEQIDKSTLRIYVQDTEDINDVRILEDDEYTISPDIVTNSGTFQFMVTYTKTGATAIGQVISIERKPTSLTATYAAKSAVTGTTLQAKDFKVFENFNNGDVVEVKDFTFNPKQLNAVGDCTITIYFEDLTTKVNIVGIAPTKPKAKLTAITATYTGATLTVGQNISADNLVVTAFYSDLSSVKLKSKDFSFTPKTTKSAGTLTVTVTYKGKSTTCNVPYKAKATTEPTQPTKPTQPVSPTSTPTPPPTPTPTPSPAPSPSSTKPSTSPSTSTSSGPGGSTSVLGGPTGSGSGSNIDPSTGMSGIPDYAKLASALYLNGATIVTKNFDSGTVHTNSVDILGEINKAKNNMMQDIDIYLNNNYKGNDITSDMLKTVKDSGITMRVNMLDTNGDTIAVWTFIGNELDNTSLTIDPNIPFVVMNRDADKLVSYSIAKNNYPKGAYLVISPSSTYYDEDSLVRLYQCDSDFTVKELILTGEWPLPLLEKQVDLDGTLNYCLSCALGAYPTDVNILTYKFNPEEINEEDSNVMDDEQVESTEDVSDTEDVSVQTPNKKSSRKIILILAVVILVHLLIFGIIFGIQVMRNKRGYDASGGFDDYDTTPGATIDEDIPEVDDDDF